jgi:hypothetical protein
MSQLSRIYDAFKADGFQPRIEAVALTANDDLSVFMHRHEVPECVWWIQYQKRLRPGVTAHPYWDMGFGRWVLV